VGSDRLSRVMEQFDAERAEQGSHDTVEARLQAQIECARRAVKAFKTLLDGLLIEDAKPSER
jgi:hypothetical protein